MKPQISSRVRPKKLPVMPPVAPWARTHSLAARAYQEIRNQILKGELPVGMALARRKLASALNISVPPVSEALQQLEHEGLVESRPRVGTRVRVPTRQDVEDRSLVREALETQAARLFAERATPAEKKALRQMGRQVDQLYATCEKNFHDREFLFSANTYHMKLHLHIAECARCPALRHAIEKEQVLVFNWLHDTAVQRRSLASNYHARLTDILARGTSVQAVAAMQEHIRRGLQEVVSGLVRLTDTQNGWRYKKQQNTYKTIQVMSRRAGLGRRTNELAPNTDS
jgi:DNA-binding GntR family transcriptional regulator